ncbi:hypothetical protein KKD95_01405, partial [Patescibacteria group bacterium]|nr:hypothetical protein [Patescibacteria group bacterium]
ESVLSILGVLIFLSPFLGVPLVFLSWVLPVLGVLVLGIALSLRRDRVRKEQKSSPSHETSTPLDA